MQFPISLRSRARSNLSYIVCFVSLSNNPLASDATSDYASTDIYGQVSLDVRGTLSVDNKFSHDAAHM